MASSIHRIGDWTFVADDNALRRGGESRRLEERAARILELLCASRGTTVPREQIVASVWGGRSQSANSVAVAIGQLRRALDDAAHRPRFIETVAKRGYRLMPAEEGDAGEAILPVTSSRRRRWALLIAGILLLGIAAGWMLVRPGPTTVAFGEVVNATGEPSQAARARATSELIVAELDRLGVPVRRGEDAGTPLRLEARLVSWNGEPTVSLSITDADGGVRWSAMARGPASRIAGNVQRALHDYTRSRGPGG